MAGTSQSGISVLICAGLASSNLLRAWTCQRPGCLCELVCPASPCGSSESRQKMVDLGSSRLSIGRHSGQPLCSCQSRGKLSRLRDPMPLSRRHNNGSRICDSAATPRCVCKPKKLSSATASQYTSLQPRQTTRCPLRTANREHWSDFQRLLRSRAGTRARMMPGRPAACATARSSARDRHQVACFASSCMANAAYQWSRAGWCARQHHWQVLADTVRTYRFKQARMAALQYLVWCALQLVNEALQQILKVIICTQPPDVCLLCVSLTNSRTVGIRFCDNESCNGTHRWSRQRMRDRRADIRSAPRRRCSCVAAAMWIITYGFCRTIRQLRWLMK